MRALIRTSSSVWLILLLCVSVISCTPSKEKGNYVEVNAEDAAMKAAIAKAKATSADFVRAFHEQKTGTKDFHVKKPYPTPGGGIEHMWIEVLSEENGVVEGVVANEAEETLLVKFGQKVSLNVSEISDWKYVDGRKLVGGYTIRYFYDKMSSSEQADFVKNAGFEM